MRMIIRTSRPSSQNRTGRDRRTTEAGRMVTMVPLAALAALICVGIGVDFAGQAMAEQELRDQVMACTRSSADWAAVTVIPAFESVASAYQCLSESGITGTAEYVGDSLTVTSSGVYQTKLLSIVGVWELPTHAKATVGVTSGR